MFKKAVKNPVIRVSGLTVGYTDTTVLENVSFLVNEGEVFVVLGGSGCGKSTLLKHMIGLYEVRRGNIVIDGDNIVTMDAYDREDVYKKIGVMYQGGALFGSMTIRENVRLPLEEFTNLSREAMDLIVSLKLKLVGLTGAETLMPSELSGGMQKRAAIARAMALDPKIIFLDEPSAGLDPITSAELDQLILRLSRTLGITFVVVTHELSSIFTIADRVIFLDKRTKGIIAEGNPHELKRSSSHAFVRQFFNREATVQ